MAPKVEHQVLVQGLGRERDRFCVCLGVGIDALLPSASAWSEAPGCAWLLEPPRPSIMLLYQPSPPCARTSRSNPWHRQRLTPPTTRRLGGRPSSGFESERVCSRAGSYQSWRVRPASPERLAIEKEACGGVSAKFSRACTRAPFGSQAFVGTRFGQQSVRCSRRLCRSSGGHPYELPDPGFPP